LLTSGSLLLSIDPSPDQFMNQEELLNQDTGSVLLAIFAGAGVAVVFGLGGFFLLKDNTASMGWVLFLVLPFATGLATALITRGKRILFASLVIGALICTSTLLVVKAEGWVCVLMSSPLIAIGMTIGALIGVLIRRKVIDGSRRGTTFRLFIWLVIPFFLMGADYSEKTSRRTLRLETISNEVIVDASPETVWHELKSFDKITGSKTFLMKIGLPVPVSCKMEGEGVGAKRTCYFEQGSIEERVTEWQPPNTMKFEIVASDVPGRPWLSFKDAAYEIHPFNGKTVVKRNTTIISRLSPAWYWRPLEAIGVEQEHEYLFKELKRRVTDCCLRKTE
jgi:polyketide cyclase/dehydrase/lipid transport protein